MCPAAGLETHALLPSFTHSIPHSLISHTLSHIFAHTQDVSGVYLLLAMPSPEMRSAAAELVVNLLEGQGREVMSATAERLKVRVV